MDISYQKKYIYLHANHWWYTSREKFVLNVIKTIWNNNNLKILDVGCGPGILLPKLKKFGKVEAIEPKESLFHYGDEIKDLIHRFTFPTDSHVLDSEQYDVILLLDVLEHIQDDAFSIFETKRLLKSGGKVIITVPAFMSLWGPHDIVNHHFRRYTMPELKGLVSKSGLRYEWGSYFFGWCFAPVWIFRRLKRITQRNKPKHDFKMPPAWLNSALRLLSCKEFKIVRKWGFPFGTSLMIIAEKE